MAFKVIETIIQNKLIFSQQTERSKNFYVRYYNALNKSYSYKSLRTNKLKEAKKKAIEFYDEQIKGKSVFTNKTNFSFTTYVEKVMEQLRTDAEQKLVSEKYSKYAIANLNNYALKFFAKDDIREVDGVKLDSFLNWCHKNNSANRQLSAATLQKIKGATLLVLKEAQRRKIIKTVPSFRKIKAVSPIARSFFTFTELNKLSRRAFADYEIIKDENEKLSKVEINRRDNGDSFLTVKVGNKTLQNYETYKIKDRSIMVIMEKKKATLKIQYGNHKRCYTADEMFQFYNWLIFMWNTYLRSNEWIGIKVKHMAIKKMTKEEISKMRLSAKNKMKKRDNKYSKFEQLHVKIVEAKNKKNIGNIRVFYRGAVDSYKRMKDAYKLKDDDYLFLNNKKNRTYAHNKMSKLFDAFLIEQQMKTDNNGEARTTYSLRHSGIVMALLDGVDTFLVSKNADTSVKMIQQYYGSKIQNIKSASLLI